MALTKVSAELSSTPGIIDNSTSTAMTIDSSGNIALTGTISSAGTPLATTSTLSGYALTSSVPTSLTDLGIIDGTTGQVLQADGDGTFSFADAASGGGGAATLVSITTTGTYGNYKIPFITNNSTSGVAGDFGLQVDNTSSDFYYNPSNNRLYADYFVGNGSTLTNVSATYWNSQSYSQGSIASGDVMASNGSSWSNYALTAGSGVTIAQDEGAKTITIASTGGGGGGGGSLTWESTTFSSYQGYQTITYPSGISTSGNYVFVAFFGNMMNSAWVTAPMDPNLFWSNMSGGDWVVYYAQINNSFAPTSEQWNFSNNGHMIYATWVVPSVISYNISGGSNSSSSFSDSPFGSALHTMLVGSSNAALDITSAVTAPSGWSSAGSATHSLDSNITVIAYQNSSPTAYQAESWNVNNNFNTYSYAGVSTST